MVFGRRLDNVSAAALSLWLQEWEAEGEDGSVPPVAFASAGEVAAMAEEGRAAALSFVHRYRLTTTTTTPDEEEGGWRYPWKPVAAGVEGDTSASAVRVPRLLEHRFEVPVTLSLGEDGEGDRQRVEVVLSGVLDRVDAVQRRGGEEGEEVGGELFVCVCVGMGLGGMVRSAWTD